MLLDFGTRVIQNLLESKSCRNALFLLNSGNLFSDIPFTQTENIAPRTRFYDTGLECKIIAVLENRKGGKRSEAAYPVLLRAKLAECGVAAWACSCAGSCCTCGVFMRRLFFKCVRSAQCFIGIFDDSFESTVCSESRPVRVHEQRFSTHDHTAGRANKHLFHSQVANPQA